MLSIRSNADAVAKLMAAAARQVPFATANGLNATVKDVQTEQRKVMSRNFAIRRQDFIEKHGVKIMEFANKTKLVTVIGNDPKANFLTKFEDGGEKRARAGRNLAVPRGVKRNKRDIITPANRPKSFDFREHITTGGQVSFQGKARGRGKNRARQQITFGGEGGKRQLKGKFRTFILHTPMGGGIYQRVGRGKKSAGIGQDNNIRLLYRFMPKAHINPRFHFHETAERVVQQRWALNFRRAFADALATARV